MRRDLAPRLLRRTLVITMCLILAACASQPPPAAPFGNTVHIGIQSDIPGWGYFRDQSYSGFDYDLANWLASDMGFKSSFVLVSPAAREQMLQQGQVDMVIATYSITDDRATKVGFAGPYMLTQQGVMVRAGDTRIRTIGDLSGKSVCAPAGTTSAQQLKTVGGVVVLEQTGTGQCVDALVNGQVDAVSTDQLVLYGSAKNRPGLQVVDDLVFGHQERYAIGLPHGDKAKCEVMREQIVKFISTGRWDDFFRKNVDPNATTAKYRPDPNLLDPCE